MTGEEFKALLKMAGPVIGTVASGDGMGRGAFMNAFQQGREIAQQEKAQRDRETQRKQQGAAKFLMDIGTHAQQFDDPVALDQFVRQFVGPAYEAGGFGSASDLSGRFTVPDSKIAAKRVKEIQSSLDALKGYDLDELAAGGAHVRLSDGTDIPVSTALDLTNARPVDTSGQAIPKPKKAPTKTGTLDERAAQLLEEADAATASGDTATATAKKAEYDRILKAKGDLGNAGRSTDAAGPAAQYEDLVALWKINHPGKELDAKTRTDLRTQANTVNDRAPAPSPGGMSAADMRAFQVGEKLAKTWTDTSKASREMKRQFSLMQTGLKRFREGDKNGGSQAVLVTFQKILDPSSVVRESEYARSASGVSLIGRIEGYMDRLRAGGAGVPEGELSAMVKTAQDMLNDMGDFTNGQRRRIAAQAKKYGVDPATVFDDVAAGNAEQATPSVQPTDVKASATAKLGRRK